MQNHKGWFFRALLVVGLSFAPRVFAGLTGADVKTVDEVRDKVICKVLGYAFELFVVLAVVMILIAAFKYLTAGEDSEKVTSAHKTITWAAVAIVVALLAKTFPLIVGSLLGVTSGITSCS